MPDRVRERHAVLGPKARAVVPATRRGNKGQPGPAGPWPAAVWEARGVLRGAEGNHDQAVALFREAADLFAEPGRPRDEVRCRAAANANYPSARR
jgi:hypothetical protein